jgi:hypothetical protein
MRPALPRGPISREHLQAGVEAMKHRNVDFDLEQPAPHKWRWNINPQIDDAPKIVGGELFDSRSSAIEACLAEIDTGLEEAPPSGQAW